MKWKFSGLAVVTAAIVLLSACSKKGPSYTRYIPKESTYVVALDVKGMVIKLQKDSLSVENMLEALKDSANPSRYSKAIEIWNQFKDAGLDLDNKIFASVPAFDMSAGSINIQVVAGLKDAKKLEAFIAKMANAPKVQKEGDVSYIVQEDAVVGWNSDAVMMLAGTSTPRYNPVLNDSNAPAPPPVPGMSNGLTEKLKKYFALSKSESIASIDAFNDVAAETADVVMFTNSSNLTKSTGNPALIMMPRIKELMNDIYSSTTINFEKGKIVMNSNTYIGSKLAGILKKYAGPTVDMSLVEAYPGTNVDGVAAFSFNPELIPELLRETGFDAVADMSLSQAGVTTADVIKAFKGDFAVVFSDFSIKPTTVDFDGINYTRNIPAGKLVFATRIGDKAAFEKIVSVGTKAGMIIKQGNRLIPAQNGVAQNTDNLVIGVENDLLVMSNDEATYKAYVAKSGKNDISSEAKKAIEGKSIAFYVDGGKVLNGIPESMFDSSNLHGKNIFLRAKQVFRTFDFSTSNFDGKKLTGFGEVIMADDKNSLSQLVSFLMYTASEMKLQQQERQVVLEQMVTPGADGDDDDSE